jgi:hypothetical protein
MCKQPEDHWKNNFKNQKVRDKSLLMPGRGLEEIFMNSKSFS